MTRATREAIEPAPLSEVNRGGEERGERVSRASTRASATVDLRFKRLISETKQGIKGVLLK